MIEVEKLEFKGTGCFSGEWCGIDLNFPITVLIGRNNSGKLQLVDRLVAETEKSIQWNGLKRRYTAILTEPVLQRRFRPSTTGSGLHGDHWQRNGNRVEIPDDVFFSHYRRDFLEAYRNFERGQGQPDTSPLLVGGNHESSETLPPKGVACRYQRQGQRKLEAGWID